jgi:hypothetical protein
MKRQLGWLGLAPIALFALASCATVRPTVVKGASNYIEKGMISARTKGDEFYMAIGQVDLYERGFWGQLRPTGKTVDIAAVIHSDKDTGEVLRIATLQPQDPDIDGSPSSYQNGVTATGGFVNAGATYTLADLRGGISIIDLQAYPHWLDALDAMKKAIKELSTYTSYAVSEDRSFVAVVPWPRVEMGFGLGWWGWPYYRGYHRFR